jgi:hypothetical protein
MLMTMMTVVNDDEDNEETTSFNRILVGCQEVQPFPGEEVSATTRQKQTLPPSCHNKSSLV